MPADCHVLRQSLTFQQQLQVAAFYRKNKETLPMGKIVYSLCNQGFSTICRQTILRHVSNKDTTCQYICKDICNSTLSQYQSGVLPALELKLYEFRIKQYTFHGEAASAPIAELKNHKCTIQEVLSQYPEDSVFNVDETAHLPSQSPKSGLASQALPGVKADKTRLTYVLGTSATCPRRL
ncbi:tigger transposable element-derived protein [Rhizoctonia solani]|uniref:Tigger transposable element-derived protein n=1 Tax=Rhizoctonia solani TaxID=456999 RepID=A0A8H8P8V8_9AGAM|nr:tigger transposable element-derived protein [Rhizoctonia solani]QRW27706.1 tigger transposable element-derived protein [Rhizoctonia solani]